MFRCVPVYTLPLKILLLGGCLSVFEMSLMLTKAAIRLFDQKYIDYYEKLLQYLINI